MSNQLETTLDAAPTAPPLKVLVFSIGSLNLGLPIDAVYKVLNSTQIYNSGSNWVGLAHMGDREVTVLDLQRRLFPEIIADNSKFESGYLMVIQNNKSELFGIPVETVPALIEVPLSSIRVLPESFRHADALGIASHVAVISESESETNLTLFLLDIDTTVRLTQLNTDTIN